MMNYEGRREIREVCYILCNVGGDFIRFLKILINVNIFKKIRFFGDFRL